MTNILNFKQINNFLKKNKIKTLVHIAGLSRPKKTHDNNINKSIELNIIGTANVVRACNNNNTKFNNTDKHNKQCHIFL